MWYSITFILSIKYFFYEPYPLEIFCRTFLEIVPNPNICSCLSADNSLFSNVSLRWYVGTYVSTSLLLCVFGFFFYQICLITIFQKHAGNESLFNRMIPRGNIDF